MTSSALLYEGPSQLDGVPIIVVASGVDGSSRNVKTGAMIQTWILLRDVSPLDAAHDGRDRSICGTCVHRETPLRGRTCYVNVAWGPHMIWKAYRAGNIPTVDALPAGAVLRLGAYGDPVAVPLDVWTRALAVAKGWTGYTHAWTDPRFADFRVLLMASVESIDEAATARAAGWRTFRVRAPGEPLRDGPREIACPASEEAGKKTTCAACRLCDGGARPKAPDVAIVAHGTGGKRLLRHRQQLALFPG